MTTNKEYLIDSIGKGPGVRGRPEEAKYLSGPRDLSGPEVDRCMKWGDLVKLPDSHGSIMEIQVPQRRADIERLFANDLDTFGWDRNDTSTLFQGGGQLSSDGRKANMVNCPLLACAACISIDTDQNTYALTGHHLPTQSGTNPTPALPAAPGPGDISQPATFSKGFDALTAKWAFAKAFRLEFVLACDFIVFSESVSVIGLAGDDGYDGTGSSLRAAHEDIRRANRQALAIGKGGQFFPQTTIGPCGPGGLPIPLPEPLAQQSIGGFNYEGLYGGCFPFPKRFLLLNQLPFSLAYVAEPGSNYFKRLLIDSLSDSESVNYSDQYTALLSANLITAAVNVGFTAVVTGAAGTTPSPVPEGGLLPTSAFGAGVDANGNLQITTRTTIQIVPRGGSTPVTLPVGTVIAGSGAGNGLVPGIATPVFVITSTSTTIGKANSVPYKDGIWRLRTTLKGFKFAPRSCYEYYKNWGYTMGPQMAELMMGTGAAALAGLAQSARMGAGSDAMLAGLMSEIKEGKLLGPKTLEAQGEPYEAPPTTLLRR